MNNGLTNAPEIVYSPIVSMPVVSWLSGLVLTKIRVPETANAVAKLLLVINAGSTGVPESVYSPTVL